VVIVAAPAAEPQAQAIDLVRKHGTVCLFASLPVGHSALTFDSRTVHYGELRIVGTSDSTPDHVRRAVELIACDAVPGGKIVSHVLPLDQILHAYALMESGEALRVVLVPWSLYVLPQVGRVGTRRGTSVRLVPICARRRGAGSGDPAPQGWAAAPCVMHGDAARPGASGRGSGGAAASCGGNHRRI